MFDLFIIKIHENGVKTNLSSILIMYVVLFFLTI